jgi:hypothetical protein
VKTNNATDAVVVQIVSMDGAHVAARCGAFDVHLAQFCTCGGGFGCEHVEAVRRHMRTADDA